MNMPWVLSKERSYTLTALIVCCLDITSNGVRRWNFEVGVSSCEEVDELGIRDNRHRAIAFSYPLRNVRTDLCER